MPKPNERYKTLAATFGILDNIWYWVNVATLGRDGKKGDFVPMCYRSKLHNARPCYWSTKIACIQNPTYYNTRRQMKVKTLLGFIVQITVDNQHRKTGKIGFFSKKKKLSILDYRSWTYLSGYFDRKIRARNADAADGMILLCDLFFGGRNRDFFFLLIEHTHDLHLGFAHLTNCNRLQSKTIELGNWKIFCLKK